jgi:hypothetical protein
VKQLTEKLIKAEKRILDLEKDIKNTRMREKRAKATLHCVLSQLQEEKQISTKLYADLLMYKGEYFPYLIRK